jgi:hypothetical protein
MSDEERAEIGIKRPIEETWEAREATYGGWQVRCESQTWLNADPWRAEEHCRLAAAAPEMARLLLELGEQPHPNDNGYRCPACGADEDPDHFDDCRLVAVLRKAGVLPEER